MGPTRRTALVTLIACLACLGVGAGVGMIALAPPTPDSLATTTGNDMPVDRRPVTDSRSLPLTIDIGVDQTLTFPTTGRVTALDIAPGTTLTSGQRTATVNDIPLVALATEQPLWRDLSDGDSGSDVSALQKELARLGEDVADTGTMNWATRAAAARLAGVDDGHGGVPSTIPLSLWLWMPSPSLTVGRVDAVRGADVTPDSPFFTLSNAVSGAHLTLPEEAIPGERQVTIAGSSYPVAEDGTLEDPAALAALAAHPGLAQQIANRTAENSEPVTLQVDWSLVTPVEAWVVPPAAVVTGGTTGACVVVGDEVVPVDVISSELGRTLVDADRDLSSLSLDVAGVECP